MRSSKHSRRSSIKAVSFLACAISSLIKALNDRKQDVKIAVIQALDTHISQFPALLSEEIQTLYKQFLVPRGTEQAISLYTREGQLYCRTANRQEELILPPTLPQCT